MELYVNFELPPEAEEELRKYFKIVRGGDLGNVEAALVSRITAEELAKMPRLKFIQVVTARLDEEVDKGVSTAWGDLMKYLHALQIQARCS
ncbi:MAG: hypothetical protein QXT27_06000 [Pyrobaculum sp.]